MAITMLWIGWFTQSTDQSKFIYLFKRFLIRTMCRVRSPAPLLSCEVYSMLETFFSIPPVSTQVPWHQIIVQSQSPPTASLTYQGVRNKVRVGGP